MRSLRELWKKIWFVLWKDDSPLSIIISFIVAYLLIQFVFYPGLGLLLGTSYPVVAVISGSMEHRANLGCTEYGNIIGIPRAGCPPDALVPMICGTQVNRTGRLSFDEYWTTCGAWYEAEGIAKGAFADFPFSRGFNTGDIMVLRRAENIAIGDVIVFEGRGTPEPIIHRVIDIQQTDRGTVYSTKGDHNAGQIVSYQQVTFGEGTVSVPIIDERRINEAQVVGKAWFRIPLLGYPKVWLTRIISAVRS